MSQLAPSQGEQPASSFNRSPTVWNKTTDDTQNPRPSTGTLADDDESMAGGGPTRHKSGPYVGFGPTVETNLDDLSHQGGNPCHPGNNKTHPAGIAQQIRRTSSMNSYTQNKFPAKPPGPSCCDTISDKISKGWNSSQCKVGRCACIFLTCFIGFICLIIFSIEDPAMETALCQVNLPSASHHRLCAQRYAAATTLYTVACSPHAVEPTRCSPHATTYRYACSVVRGFGPVRLSAVWY